MKKKILVFSLVLLMSVSLCACKGGADDVGNSENKIEMTSDGQPIVTQKMLAQYIQKVEITEENWKDYIDIIEEEVVQKNPFGEVVDTSVRREWGCKKGQCAYFSSDFAIELKWNSDKRNPWGETLFLTGEGGGIDTNGVPTGYIDNMYPEWNVDYVQEDYLFVRVKGAVLILDLPEELWSTNKEGVRGIYIGAGENAFYEQFEVSNMLNYVYETYK